MVPELLVVALDYYRSPLRYRHLGDPQLPLPRNFDTLISELAAALSPHVIAATARLLHKSRREVEDAAVFFLRWVLLSPGADHYRVLGLSPGASEEAIQRHYHLLVRLFHPDRSRGDASLDAAYTARLNEAYRSLRNPAARRRYDQRIETVSGRIRAIPGSWELMRPDHPVPLSLFDPKPLRLARNRVRLFAALALAGLAVIALLLVLRVTNSPVLYSNPELAKRPVSGPSFLSGTTPGTRQPDTTPDGGNEPVSIVHVATRPKPTPDEPTVHGVVPSEPERLGLAPR